LTKSLPLTAAVGIPVLIGSAVYGIQTRSDLTSPGLAGFVVSRP
jgi:hypothetical protein